jgi:uncharacterized protein (TIGR02246 family)
MAKENRGDREAIEATVRRYIDGIAKSNPDGVDSAFHPDATMTGHFGGKFTSVQHAGRYIADYMRKIEPTHVHSPKFSGSITSVLQEADIASVAIAESQLQGHEMRTFFQLHKIDGKWLITAKATTILPD